MVVRNTRSLKKKLGDILVDVGIITQDQLKQALEIQRSKGGKLGNILQEMNFCSEEVLLAFLGRQCGVSYISLAEYGNISPDVIKLVPESMVRQQSIMPLSCDDNVLTIAMSDPLNVFATDDLKQLTGCDIKVVIASQQEILDSINQNYGNGQAAPANELQAPATVTTADFVTSAALPTVEQAALRSGSETASPDNVMHDLLKSIISSGASDIQIEQADDSLQTNLRVDGFPQSKTKTLLISPADMLAKLKGMAGWGEEEHPDEGRIKINIDGRETVFRLNVQNTFSGWESQIHFLNPRYINADLSFLGMEKDVADGLKPFLEKPKGIILVSGPSGNGLTTTYYSVLSALAKDHRRILSIESPVEFLLPGSHQIDAPRLRRLSGISLMHQSPDVMALSDMNTSQETAALIEAVSGGAFGLASLQARSVAEAIAHFFQMTGVGGWTVSLLEWVLFQRFVRLLCPACKKKTSVPIEALSPDATGDMPAASPSGRSAEIYQARGCDQCGQTGYKGRIAVFECCQITESVRKKIVQGATASQLEFELAQGGQITITQAALLKVVAGATSLDEAKRVIS